MTTQQTRHTETIPVLLNDGTPATLTTAHAASCHGQPVLVARNGQAYGPGDIPLPVSLDPTWMDVPATANDVADPIAGLLAEDPAARTARLATRQSGAALVRAWNDAVARMGGLCGSELDRVLGLLR